MRPHKLMALLLLIPSISTASFIETTMGTAVVNDATAAYFNPAALMLLKNTQIIPLATVSRFNTQFSGSSTVVPTGFTATGNSNSTSNFYSPSLYFGMPLNQRITLGFASVVNFANRNPEESSLLRYAQSSNTIQDYDFVPSVGVKINDYLALGAGVNFSYVNFNLNPILGFPGSDIADSQSNNHSTGSGLGANAGFLLRLTPRTLMGFNYRTVTTYNEKGNSVITGPAPITSNTYHFQLRTPARSVLSISHWISPTLAVISTVQRIQWSIVRNVNIYNLATLAPSGVPVIISASVPYYLHNTWLLTLGGNYKFKPDWILRVAGTYLQSPNNGHYQLSTGDSYVLGASLGYAFNSVISLDGGYAHAFIKTEPIHIAGSRFLINGNNTASRDVVSLKVTFNI